MDCFLLGYRTGKRVTMPRKRKRRRRKPNEDLLKRLFCEAVIPNSGAGSSCRLPLSHAESSGPFSFRSICDDFAFTRTHRQHMLAIMYSFTLCHPAAAACQQRRGQPTGRRHAQGTLSCFWQLQGPAQQQLASRSVLPASER